MSETNPKEESVTQAQSNTSENFKATDAESIRNSKILSHLAFLPHCICKVQEKSHC